MKIYVKQMYDWNCYAYIAEDVEPAHWNYFTSELWWQVGSSFIRVYDNVPDFCYCAENFKQFGETAILQELRLLPCPWEKALDWVIPELEALGVCWYLHGSAAMALHGIDVSPRNVNIIFPDSGDFVRVREHFYKKAIRPFEKCDNWVMSGLGDIFVDAFVGFAFANPGVSCDFTALNQVERNGHTVYLAALETLLKDNQVMGRLDRAAQIQAKMDHHA